MGFQLLYWHYLQDINHPLLNVLNESPQSFVGEDVELSLMLLSNYASTTNLTRKTEDVSDAYKKLGLLSQIAKKVRKYKVSRFGGQTKSRSRVTYNSSSPEVASTLTFVRQWITKTEDNGLLSYKMDGKKKLIGKRASEQKRARRFINVSLIDLRWQQFATSMIEKHLDALDNNSDKVSVGFDRAFMQKFTDLYSFDDRAMDRFQEDPGSDSSMDELPLASEEWKSQMEAEATLLFDYSEEAKSKERKRKEQLRLERKMAAEQQQRPAKRPRGRPRKKLAAPSAVEAVSHDEGKSLGVFLTPPNRGRGRPKGSRNKKTLERLAEEQKLIATTTSSQAPSTVLEDRFALFGFFIPCNCF